MVGTVSLSLPTIPVIEQQWVGDSHPLLYVRWHERVYDKDDQGDDVWWHERRELFVYGRDMREQLLSSTGSHFFHQLVYRYEQARAKQTQPKNKWAENDGLKLYPTFEWTAQGMDGAGTTWIWLSFSVNWRFTNLNVAFRAVVGDPTRTLHVYSDVAGSSVVGNRVTDLLREIQYKRQGRGTMYFEPLHVQYLPLRSEVVEIIHIQVAETIGTGDLVKFGDGHTIVTLHFKKT